MGMRLDRVLLRIKFNKEIKEGEDTVEDTVEDKVNKEIKEGEDTDEDTDEETDEDTDEGEDNLALNSWIFDNNKFKIYETEARKFVNNIIMWSCQRELNKEHVETLKNSITKRGYVIGTFKVIINNCGELRCIDGQHRVEALKKIMITDSKFNCDLIIEGYEVIDFESEEATNLFYDANCSLNVTGTEPNKLVQSIIRRLEKEYPEVIRDVLDGKKCNRPYINKRELASKLKELVLNCEEYEIIEAIINMNNNMGMWSTIKIIIVGKLVKNKFINVLIQDVTWDCLKI
jgi:hypothetical protein